MAWSDAILEWAGGLDEEEEQPRRKYGAPRERPAPYTQEWHDENKREEEDFGKRFSEASSGGKKMVPRDYGEYELAQKLNQGARESNLPEPFEDNRPYTAEQEGSAWQKHVEQWTALPDDWEDRLTNSVVERASKTAAARAQALLETSEKDFLGGFYPMQTPPEITERRKATVPLESDDKDTDSAYKSFLEEYPEVSPTKEEFSKAYSGVYKEAAGAHMLESFRNHFLKDQAELDAQRFIGRYPGAGIVDQGTNILRARSAAKSIEAGKGTIADYRELGKHMARVKVAEDRGINVGDLLLDMPAFVFEFAATGGAAAGAKKGAEKLGLKVLGKMATTAVGKAAIGTTSFAAQGYARALASPQRVFEKTAGVMLSDQLSKPDEQLDKRDRDFFQALPTGFQKVANEMLGEQLGGVFAKIPVPQRFSMLRGALERLGNISNKTGLSPIESLEERFTEVLGGLTTEDDFGVTGALATAFRRPDNIEQMAADLERRRAAYKQLAVEMAAFAIPGMAVAGASFAGAVLDKRQSDKLRKDLGLDGLTDDAARAKLADGMVEAWTRTAEAVNAQRRAEAEWQTGKLPINFPMEANDRLMPTEELQPYIDEHRRAELPTLRPGSTALDPTVSYDDPGMRPTEEFRVEQGQQTQELPQLGQELVGQRHPTMPEIPNTALVPAAPRNVAVPEPEQENLANLANTIEDAAGSMVEDMLHGGLDWLYTPKEQDSIRNAWRTVRAAVAASGGNFGAIADMDWLRENMPQDSQEVTEAIRTIHGLHQRTKQQAPAPTLTAGTPAQVAAPAEVPQPVPVQQQLPTSEVVTPTASITNEAKSIIEGKVRQLGSQAEVDSFYDSDTAADQYAREFARTVYQPGAEQVTPAAAPEPMVPQPNRTKEEEHIRNLEAQGKLSEAQHLRDNAAARERAVQSAAPKRKFGAKRQKTTAPSVPKPVAQQPDEREKESMRHTVRGMFARQPRQEVLQQLTEIAADLERDTDPTSAVKLSVVKEFLSEPAKRKAGAPRKVKAAPVEQLVSLDSPDFTTKLTDLGRTLKSNFGETYEPGQPVYRSHKVYIADLYEQMKPAGTLDQFKAKLLDLHRKGELELSRQDLPQFGNEARTAASEINWGNAQWHTVNVNRDPADARRQAKQQPAAAQPEPVAQQPAEADLLGRIKNLYDRIHLPETSFGEVEALTETMRPLSKEQAKQIAEGFGMRIPAGMPKAKIVGEIQRKLYEQRGSADRIRPINPELQAEQEQHARESLAQPPATPAEQRAQAAADRFGITIERRQWDDPSKKGAIDKRNPTTIMVSDELAETSESNEDAFYGVVVHEMHHSLRQTDPRAWLHISAAIEEMDPKGLAKEETKYIRDLEKTGRLARAARLREDAGERRNEGVSRYVQRRLVDTEFVERLAGKKPGIFTTIVDALRKVLGGFSKKNQLADRILGIWDGVAAKREAVAQNQDITDTSQTGEQPKRKYGAPKPKPETAGAAVQQLIAMHQGHPRDWPSVGQVETLIKSLSHAEVAQVAKALDAPAKATRMDVRSQFLNRLESWSRIQFRPDLDAPAKETTSGTGTAAAAPEAGQPEPAPAAPAQEAAPEVGSSGVPAAETSNLTAAILHRAEVNTDTTFEAARTSTNPELRRQFGIELASGYQDAESPAELQAAEKLLIDYGAAKVQEELPGVSKEVLRVRWVMTMTTSKGQQLTWDLGNADAPAKAKPAPRKAGAPKPAKSAPRQAVEAWLQTPESKKVIRSAVKRAGFKWDEDLHDAIVMKALEKADQFNPEKAQVGTWVSSLARNAAVDEVRDRGMIKMPHTKGAVPMPVRALGEREGRVPEPTGKLRGAGSMAQQADEFRQKQAQEEVPAGDPEWWQEATAQIYQTKEEAAISAALAAGELPADQPQVISENTLKAAVAPTISASATGKRKGKVRSSNDIIRDMGNAFDVPIRFNRIAQKAAAIYKWLPEVIRIRGKFAGSLPVATHEVGHHLDKTTNVLSGAPAQAQAEVAQLDYEPNRGDVKEGLAEFFRLYMTTDGDHKMRAPLFSSWFESWMLDNFELAAKIDRAKQMIDDWRFGGSMTRIQAAIKPDHRPPSAPLRERAKEALHRWYTNWKDNLHPLRRMGWDREKLGGKKGKLGKGESALELAQALGHNAPVFALQAIQEGPRSVKDYRKLGPGMNEAFVNIQPAEMPELMAFMVAGQAKEMAEQDKARAQATGEPLRERTAGPFLPEDADQVLREINDNPEKAARFNESRKIFRQFRAGIILMLQDAGVISKEEATYILKSSEWAIPLKRVMDVDAATRAGHKLIDLAIAVKTRKGSGRNIVDPVYSAIQEALQHYDTAIKTLQMQAVKQEAASVGGMAKWVTRVPPGQERIQVLLQDLKAQLEKEGIEEDMLESLDPAAKITIYRPDVWMRQTGAMPVGATFVNGKRELDEYHPALFEAIGGLNELQFEQFLPLWAGMAQVAKLGFTGLNPAFTIPNAIIDYTTYFFRRRYGGILGPLEGHARVAGQKLVEAATGEQDIFLTWFKRMGVPMTHSMSEDYNSLTRITREVKGQGPGVLGRGGQAVDLLRDIVGFTESGTRFAEFIGALRAQGVTADMLHEWDKHGVPEKDRAKLIEATNAANDVTINFRRMGKYMQKANSVVPFLNASTEALDGWLRTAGSDPMTFMVRSAMYAGAVLAYWYKVKDDDEWIEAPFWKKFTQLQSMGFVDRIPMRGEPLAFIGIPVIAIAESLERRNIRPLQEGGREALKQVFPGGGIETSIGWLPGLKPAGTPVAEAILNWDLFRGRPVYDDKYNKVEAADEVLPWNTTLMKQFGKWANISPARLEHAVEGVTGGLYRRIGSAVAPSLVEPRKKLGGFEKVPIIGPTVAEIGSRFSFSKEHSQSIDDFYRERDDAEKAYNSAKKHGEIPPAVEARHQRIGRYGRFMGELKNLAKANDDPQTRKELERFQIGLARFVMGQEPLKTYPNPLIEIVPEEVASIRDHFIAVVTDKTIARQPMRKAGERDTAYAKRKAEWEAEKKEGQAILDELKVSKEHAHQAKL